MDGISWFFLGIHILVWGGIIGGLIYLIFRRMRLKKEEDFENRSN